MDNDSKWFMIMIMVLFVGMFTAGTVGEYTRHQCKMTLAQSNRTVEEIEKICK
jgi:CHASE1-domain containing sensor protein